MVSIAGIIVGTMAIIIVVSVVNGFSDLLGQFYSSFDPDLKITSVEGKMFNPSDFNFDKVKTHPDVAQYAEIIEEMALLKYGSQIYPATVKGVPKNYNNYTNIDSLLVKGSYTLEQEGINYAVIGHGVAINLGIGLSFVDHIMVYVPKRGKQVSLNPSRAINHNYVFPSGIFSVLEEIDSKYIIVSYDFAADLFESKNQVSSVEISLSEDSNQSETQSEIQDLLGDGFHVKNNYQQHEFVFKTTKSEKWAAYFILVFILLLASVNMIGNLTMLYIDKKEDISILRSMGLSMKKINQIFLYEGWLISFLGGVVGTVLGIFVCWLQIEFGLIRLPGATGSFVISAYPVQIIFTDILLAFLAVMVIGFVASWYPVKFISQKHLSESNIN
ncbi:FtsX-like permease family protein [Draconibacterium sp.]|nr:FtsX-like permease family protein [Draconibacterium sp.]